MTRAEKYPNTDTFMLYNANPKNRITDDCTIRAISLALNIPYNTVVMELAYLQCETGYDATASNLIDRYLVSKGWIKHRQERKANNRKYTGKEFCLWLNEHSRFLGTGNVVAMIGGHHIVCIKCSFNRFKVHDTWDSTDGCVGNWWTKG